MPAALEATYKDPHRHPADRAADLLQRLSLQEKLAQLGSVWARELLDRTSFALENGRERIPHGIGFVTCPGGASLLTTTQIVGFANELQKFLIDNTRLGIPAILTDECLSGFMARGVTTFPQSICLASSWDPELVGQMASATRCRMKEAGVRLGLSPVLDVARDPRWGRVEETFGEDPYLASRLGVAYVRGLQTDDLRDGVAATGKHFAGYSASEGGRNCSPAHIGQRELAEVFLPPFAAAIDEAGLSAVMNGYHEIDGIPCGSSKELLTTILRERMGFNGVVLSDFHSIEMLCTHHRMAQGEGDAAKLAICAGVDVELPRTACYGSPLAEALEQGEITQDLVDRAVSRVLELKFRLGLFESPFVDDRRLSEEDRTSDAVLARSIAEGSIVLLKNDRGLLPLGADLRSIAVIGPNAMSGRRLLGDYSYAAGIEYEDYDGALHVPRPIREQDYLTIPVPTIVDAIRARVSPRTKVLLVTADPDLDDKASEIVEEAVGVARQAQVVILVLGGKSGQVPDCSSGEFRDRARLELLPGQERLARALSEVEVPLVAVLVDGRPLAIPWLAERADALLEAWLPGQEGAAALAGILFGDVNPSGKLPVSFPRSDGTMPFTYDHRPSGSSSYRYGDYVDAEVAPLFCFGHGLSYTHFEYSNLRVQPSVAGEHDAVVIQLDLTNTGPREGAEVIQVYVRQGGTSVTRPVKQLVAFEKVHLQSSQTETIQLELPVSGLRYLDPEMRWTVSAGTTMLMVGSSCEDIRLTGSFEVR